MYLNVKQKKRIPPKTVLFFSAVFVVLVIFTIGTVMLLTTGKDIKDSLVKMPFKTSDAYIPVGNTLIYTSGNILTCTDSGLKDKWKVQLDSNGLNYTSHKTLIAAAGQDVLMVFNEQGANLFSKRLDGKINSVRLGKDKVAVNTDQVLSDKTISYIIIFSLDGSDIFKLDISGKYVLDYGFDASSSQLYILELDVTGAAPVSRVSTYRPESQSMTGIKELKDQLVESVYFTETSVFTMGTKELTEYSSLNAEGNEMLVYGWMLEDICERQEIRFVYVPSSSSGYYEIARVIDPKGDEIKINLPPNVFKILHYGEKIYCFATNNIFVYTGEGKYFRTYNMPFPVDGAKRAMDGYVFLTAGEDVYLLPLP